MQGCLVRPPLHRHGAVVSGAVRRAGRAARRVGLSLASSLVIATWTATVAAGYWAALGGGSGLGSTGALGAPTVTSAVAGAGTVSLAWSAVTPPGSDPVRYFVTRGGGAAGGDCPTRGSTSRDALLHGRRPEQGHLHLHRHRGVALVVGDERACDTGRRGVRRPQPPRAPGGHDEPDRRRGRQPHREGKRRRREHGHRVHGHEEPHVRRGRHDRRLQPDRHQRLRHRRRLRRHDRDHLLRRRRHGVGRGQRRDAPVQAPRPPRSRSARAAATPRTRSR